MAFQTKTDYCGLVAATTPSGGSAVLELRDSNLNGSNEVYRPMGQTGDFAGVEVYGEDSSPSNSYGLKADATIAANAIKLNGITSVSTGSGSSIVTKKYALETVTIGTSAGSPVAISATSQEVEEGATDASNSHYNIPSLTLKKAHSAQILFGAFELSGTGCQLTACSATIGCTVGKDKVAGVKISSDCNSGLITITGTILQTSTTAPTLTATSGWMVTKLPLPTETNAETAYKSYTFEVTKALTRTDPSQNSGTL